MIQGVAAAIITPAALSLLSATFAEGPERTRALGTWGAVAPVGGSVGILLGGFLIVNVPGAVMRRLSPTRG